MGDGELKRKDKIYYYLIRGYAPVKTAKLTKCSKPYVSKITKQLIKNGYIYEVFKDGQATKPKLYSKTDKTYPTKLTSYPSGTQISLKEQPRLNMIAMKFDILEPPKKEVPGKQFVAGNTVFVDYSKLFKEGAVTFRLISDKILVVFMPETIVSPDSIRHTKQLLYKRITRYSNWFQKRFHCKLGDSSLYQDYHIAIHESDPFLSEMARKYGMLKVSDSSGNVIAWWDFSKGPCEFETRDEKIAENRVFAPIISMNLQDRVYYLESEIEAQKLVIEALNTKFDDIERLIKEVKEILTPKPIGPDEKRDVT